MSTGKVILYGGLGFVATTVLVRLGLSAQYEALYAAAGAKWGVAPEKLHALALQESREDPSKISPPNTNGTRDYGLMQINSSNLARLGLTVTTAMDAATSADAAARLLASNKQAAPQLNIFDEFSVYNAGFAEDPDGTLRAHLNAHGVYTDLAYVLSVMAWYVVVWLSKLSLIHRF